MIENFKGKANTNGFNKNPANVNKNGRKIGSKNRNTIAQKLLNMRCTLSDIDLDKLKKVFPEIDNIFTVEEIMTIVQIYKAIFKADVRAYLAIMNSAYGNPNRDTSIDVDELDDDVLYALYESLY